MNRTILCFVTVLATACAEEECFARGTQIATPQGDRPIEDLAPGDEVFAFDVAHRRVVRRRVLACHLARADHLFRLAAGEVVLRGVTRSHPIYDASRETFVRVDDVGTRASIVVWRGPADPHARPLSALTAIPVDGEVDVFNLSVEGAERTFFADGVLVHNKSVRAVDPDNDGFDADDYPVGDCDDHDPEVHPAATEVCNGKDDDCDKAVDEQLVCGEGGGGGTGGAGGGSR